MKQFRFQEILAGICLIGLLVSFIMLIGTAGAIDCDDLALSDGIRIGSIWLIILICSVIGIIHAEKDESAFDNL